MISNLEKNACCGCGNCASVCPSKAIKMDTDEVGFVFPYINTDLCSECGLCLKKCPVMNHNNEKDLNHKFYVAYAKDEAVRFNGSSGGMFGLIAKKLIDNSGVVYGAAFDKELKLKCTRATTEKELLPLYKSKYIQSNLGESFLEIKNELEKGKQVLFTSTPCQVYALKLYLNKEYNNLFTVDFVCHGVPSQELFDKCRNYVEEKEKIELIEYGFRAKKKNGATPHYYKIKYKKNGKIRTKISLYINSPFYYGFQKYITLRDSCYDCRFAYSNRVSDITIGDFHEVDKYISGINRFDGVSGIVINTEKGNTLWNEIKNDTVYYPLDFAMILDNKELMCGGTKKPAEREEFVNDLKVETFDKVVEKYLNGKRLYTKKLYYALPSVIRKFMKKVLIK